MRYHHYYFTVLLVVLAVIFTGCFSGSSTDSASYQEQLNQWNTDLLFACGGVGNTVYDKTEGRVSACMKHIDALASFVPPEEHASSHSTLQQLGDNYVIAVSRVEQVRPAASAAAARSFPAIWSRMLENDRFYRCNGSEDFWGYGNGIHSAPSVVYDLRRECVAEEESRALMSSQFVRILGSLNSR